MTIGRPALVFVPRGVSGLGFEPGLTPAGVAAGRRPDGSAQILTGTFNPWCWEWDERARVLSVRLVAGAGDSTRVTSGVRRQGRTRDGNPVLSLLVEEQAPLTDVLRVLPWRRPPAGTPVTGSVAPGTPGEIDQATLALLLSGLAVVRTRLAREGSRVGPLPADLSLADLSEVVTSLWPSTPESDLSDVPPAVLWASTRFAAPRGAPRTWPTWAALPLHFVPPAPGGGVDTASEVTHDGGGRRRLRFWCGLSAIDGSTRTPLLLPVPAPNDPTQFNLLAPGPGADRDAFDARYRWAPAAELDLTEILGDEIGGEGGRFPPRPPPYQPPPIWPPGGGGGGGGGGRGGGGGGGPDDPEGPDTDIIEPLPDDDSGEDADDGPGGGVATGDDARDGLDEGPQHRPGITDEEGEDNAVGEDGKTTVRPDDLAAAMLSGSAAGMLSSMASLFAAQANVMCPLAPAGPGAGAPHGPTTGPLPGGTQGAPGGTVTLHPSASEPVPGAPPDAPRPPDAHDLFGPGGIFRNDKGVGPFPQGVPLKVPLALNLPDGRVVALNPLPAEPTAAQLAALALAAAPGAARITPAPGQPGAPTTVWGTLHALHEVVRGLQEVVASAFVGGRHRSYAGNLAVLARNDQGTGVAPAAILGREYQDVPATTGALPSAVMLLDRLRGDGNVERASVEVERDLKQGATADAAILRLRKIADAASSDTGDFLECVPPGAAASAIEAVARILANGEGRFAGLRAGVGGLRSVGAALFHAGMDVRGMLMSRLGLHLIPRAADPFNTLQAGLFNLSGDPTWRYSDGTLVDLSEVGLGGGLDAMRGLEASYFPAAGFTIAPGRALATDGTTTIVLSAGVTVTEDSAPNAANGYDRVTLTGTTARTALGFTLTGTGTAFLTEFGVDACTGTISGAGTTITGTGTAFLSEVWPGDMIGSPTLGYRQVVGRTSDTSVTIAAAFLVAASGHSYNRIEAPTVWPGNEPGPRQVLKIDSDTALEIYSDWAWTNTQSGVTTYANDTTNIDTTTPYGDNIVAHVQEFLHLWVVKGASGVAGYASRRRTSVLNPPIGYTAAARRVGAFLGSNPAVTEAFATGGYRVGSGAFRYYAFGGDVVSNGCRVLNGGTATTATVVTCGPEGSTGSINSVVPPTSRLVTARVAAVTQNARVADGDDTGFAGVGPLLVNAGTQAFVDVPLNRRQRMAYANDAGGGSTTIVLAGFWDDLRIAVDP